MFSTWDVRPLWAKHKLNCVIYVILNTIQKEKNEMMCILIKMKQKCSHDKSS